MVVIAGLQVSFTASIWAIAGWNSNSYNSRRSVISNLTAEIRVERAIELYPCDLLFVHRDAEKELPEKRVQEIVEACAGIKVGVAPVPVIPIRMSESWLLCDETAIRKAAGNPNGEQPLNLPRLRGIEGLADPKVTLHTALRFASGLSGRRLKAFLPRARLVANYITDFSALRQLAAFQRLETDLRNTLAARGMLR